MTHKDQVESWIQWSRDNVPSTGDIPKISAGSPEFPVPWEHEFASFFCEAKNDQNPLEELLTNFADRLSATPGDLAVRFTALNLYYKLAHCDSYPFHEDEISEKRAGFLKQLGILIGFLKVEECPADWRIVRWEILNSYANLSSGRAIDLYDFAEKHALPHKLHARLLRGQFRFLAVFGPKLNDEFDLVDWEPKVFSAGDFPRDVLLFAWGSLHLKPEMTLDEQELGMLGEAKNDMEAAISSLPNVPATYRSLLGRCYSATDHPYDAAAQYQRILTSQDDDIFHDEGYRPMRQSLRKLVYESAALCYRSAGDREKEIEVLERWAQEFPNERGICSRLAEIHAEAKDLPLIAEDLRREETRDPAVLEDPFLSILVAIGETQQYSEAEKSALRAKPEFEQLKPLLTEYWPSFADLTERAKEEWLYGIIEAYFPLARGDAKNTYARKACAAFAVAVEIELFEKVFLRFRQFAGKRPDLLSAASDAIQGEKEDKKPVPFAKFMREEKNSDLSIGSMAHILDQCKKSNHPLFEEFARWAGSEYPNILQLVGKIWKIKEFRNPALHKGVAIETMEKIPGWCREVIDGLYIRKVNA